VELFQQLCRPLTFMTGGFALQGGEDSFHGYFVPHAFLKYLITIWQLCERFLALYENEKWARLFADEGYRVLPETNSD
jgi:hypothetical protein